MPGGSCSLTSIALTVNAGMLRTTIAPSTIVGVTFANTRVAFTNVTFDSNCVPISYLLSFNGPASLLNPAGAPIPVTFANLSMNVHNSADPALLQLTGGISSTCFGGSANVVTILPLGVPSGGNCPTAGELSVSTAAGYALVYFRSDESIDIDADSN